MGVPKFFRFISERYPCLSELVRENQVIHPEKNIIFFDFDKAKMPFFFFSK